MKKKYLPININIADMPSLVIGGGKIAYRKLLTLWKFGSTPDIISPELIPAMQAFVDKHNLKLTKRKYLGGDVQGYKIVFAATGDPIADQLIKDDCEEANILLNVADVPDLCTFIMPATVKRGDLVLAVGSGGNAPFLVKQIRKQLQRDYPKHLSEVFELAGEFRDLVLTKENLSPDSRNALFEMFISEKWDEILSEQGMDSARIKIKEISEIIK
jgi:precorrin-2 dehydrogenase / sirohydrochlorin ferrochelatase